MQYIISESQVKRLLRQLLHEQEEVTTPEEPESDESPVDGSTPETIPAANSSSSPEGDTTVSGSGSMPGGSGGGSDAFDGSSASADANSKVSVWDSGVSRGPANQISNTVWKQNITRGAANTIDDKATWAGVVGVKTSRGRANPLK